MSMKKSSVARWVLVAAGLAAGAAIAATTATGNASATVLTELDIQPGNPLAFGEFSAGTLGGTVVMPTSGTRGQTGSVVLGTGVATSAATFNVTGDPDRTYVVTLPTAASTLTHTTDNTKTMSLDTFTVTDDDVTRVLSATGTETIQVGATLHVGPTQAAGDYTGTFQVSVAYN